jgi:hypothetical protein
LMAPQHLPLVRETVRFNACLLSEHASKSMWIRHNSWNADLLFYTI